MTQTQPRRDCLPEHPGVKVGCTPAVFETASNLGALAHSVASQAGVAALSTMPTAVPRGALRREEARHSAPGSPGQTSQVPLQRWPGPSAVGCGKGREPGPSPEDLSMKTAVSFLYLIFNHEKETSLY